MKGDDYTKGRHFWVHFVCGLPIGAIIGAWQLAGVFESTPAFCGALAIFTLLFACAVAYWGDPLWRWIIWAIGP